jgi:predicted nucleic acid-binding protein
VSAQICVLDASVGVKWFRDEAGADEARDLLARYRSGALLIAVDTLFYYEVMRASARGKHPRDAERVWQELQRLDLATVPLGDELVGAAVSAAERLGCALYDAFAAGLSDLLDAPLYSADERAHGKHPRVRLVGA